MNEPVVCAKCGVFLTPDKQENHKCLPEITQASISGVGGAIEGIAHVVVGWGAKDFGFGLITITTDARSLNRTHKTKIRAETMGKDFIKAVLCKLVDDAEIVE